MKVLQINMCHYRRGGADVVYLNTSQLLQDRGIEVINYSAKSANNIKIFNNEYFINEIDFLNATIFQKLLRLPRFFYSFEAKTKLGQLIKKERPDVAHIHTYKGVLTPSILVPLVKNNIPIVFTLHDYGLLCPNNLFLDGKGEICERCLIDNSTFHCISNKCNRNNFILSTLTGIEYEFHKRFFPFHKYFTKLIAVSKFGLAIHSRKNDLKEKLEHLYNFDPNLKTIKPNSRKGDYFLYFGRLSHEKGIQTLLSAWKLSGINSRLKIVGDGPQRTLINMFIKKNNIDNIDVLGFKNGNELHEIINQASFVIIPSEWYENNPMTIIEAYSNGKPVIASIAGGIPEIVIDNKTGFLFNMKDAYQLSILLTQAKNMSQEEYGTMSEEAHKFAIMNFSEDVHFEKLIKIYKNVIRTKSVD